MTLAAPCRSPSSSGLRGSGLRGFGGTLAGLVALAPSAALACGPSGPLELVLFLGIPFGILALHIALPLVSVRSLARSTSWPKRLGVLLVNAPHFALFGSFAFGALSSGDSLIFGLLFTCFELALLMPLVNALARPARPVAISI